MALGKLVDMTGQLVNGWSVIERASTTRNGSASWWCKCEKCGAPRLLTGNQLRKPHKLGYCSKCYKSRTGGRELIDITGETRGTWRVLARVANPKTRWRCGCIRCGFDREVDGSQLKAEPPGCVECKRAPKPVATEASELQRSLSPNRVVVAFDPDEQGAPARCSVCRSMAMFLRGRCGVCGSAWSAERLPHVVVAPKRSEEERQSA